MENGAMPVYQVGSNDFGGSWIWVILLFFLIGGNGFGFNNSNPNATRDDVQRGFDTNTIINKLDGLANGLCDGFYAMNSSLKDGNFATQQGLCNIGHQIQECCCTLQNTIRAEGETTRHLITENTIQQLRDELDQARGIISNKDQSRYILDSLGRYVQNPACPPAYYGCACGANNLY